MLKVDFHTHSTASYDGGIKPEQYRQLLEKGVLHCVAVTDHNRVDLALLLHAEFPEKIIVGEEVMTTSGELIGLFLTQPIPAGLPALEAAKLIRLQGGLVYVPHPFETNRHGLTKEALEEIRGLVDVVEVHNGRALLQNRGPQAATWARLNHMLGAVSSDAHGLKGVGTTYTILKELPTAKNLMEQLPHARLVAGRPPLKTLLYPKAHRLKKKLAHS